MGAQRISDVLLGSFTEYFPSPFARVSLMRNIHTILLRGLSTLVLTIALPLHAQRAPKSDRGATRIAVYDSKIIFDSMPERRAVESEFALEQAKARTLVAQASDSLRVALDQLVKAEERLTPREREVGKLHLRASELMVEQMIENLDRVIQQRMSELSAPLQARVQEVVRIVRARRGFHIAIDRADGGMGIDADDALDITPFILEELRRTQAKPGAKTGPTEKL